MYFLILHHLARGPCSQAFDALQQEVSKHGLLPSRTDIFGEHFSGYSIWQSWQWQVLGCSTLAMRLPWLVLLISQSICAGNHHLMTYEELQQKHPHVPLGMLDQLLSQTLKAKRESGVPGCEGLTSLLGAGPHPPVSAIRYHCPHCRHRSYASGLCWLTSLMLVLRAPEPKAISWHPACSGTGACRTEMPGSSSEAGAAADGWLQRASSAEPAAAAASAEQPPEAPEDCTRASLPCLLPGIRSYWPHADIRLG